MNTIDETRGGSRGRTARRLAAVGALTGLLLAAPAGHGPDRGDAPGVDGDVGVPEGGARAVGDGGAPDDEVVVRSHCDSLAHRRPVGAQSTARSARGSARGSGRSSRKAR